MRVHKPSRDRQGVKTHFTHSYLWNASQSALWQGYRDPAAAPYAGWGLLALVASALAVEAYLNYLGPKLIGNCDKAYYRLKPKDKLKRVAKAAGYSLVLEGTTYKAFRRLFRLRNRLAHGQPERMKASWRSFQEGIEGERALEVDWMVAAEPAVVYQLLGLVHDLIAELARSAGEDLEPFITMSESETRGRPSVEPG